MDKKNFFQRMKMPLPELEEYYRTCRADAYNNNEPIKGIKWRKQLHFLLDIRTSYKQTDIRGETVHHK